MQPLIDRCGLPTLIAVPLSLMVLVLFAMYGERFYPFDGIAFDAPRCTVEQADQPKLNECQRHWPTNTA